MSVLFKPFGAGARRRRTLHRRVEEGAERTRRNRRVANSLLWRRADRAQGSGRTGAPRFRRWTVFQPDHFGGVADARQTGGAGRCRLEPCADQFSRRRGSQRRSDRRFQGPRQKARGGALDSRAGHAAHRQRGDASPKPASVGGHHPDGGRPRCRPARSGQCAILRLGAEEPRRADADVASSSTTPRSWWTKRASGSRACWRSTM